MNRFKDLKQASAELPALQPLDFSGSRFGYLVTNHVEGKEWPVGRGVSVSR